MKFMFQWVLNELREINRKLDILIARSGADFTKEDSSVKKMTEQVQAAERRIPPRAKPTKGKEP